jgi:hypothetical protein
MHTLSWLLILLAAAAFVVGSVLAFTHGVLGIPPVGYWRGAVGFLLFAIALKVMAGRSNA